MAVHDDQVDRRNCDHHPAGNPAGTAELLIRAD